MDVIEEKIHQLIKLRDSLKKDKNTSSDEEDYSRRSLPRVAGKKVTGILKASSKSPPRCHMRQSISSDCLTEKTSQNMSEFVGVMQAQLNAYKQTQESNIKLIDELKTNLEALTSEKAKSLSEKDETIKRIGEAYSTSNRKVETLENKNG